MTKYKFKLGNSKLPTINLYDDSSAREFTIRLGKIFESNCKCFELGTNRKVYEYKK